MIELNLIYSIICLVSTVLVCALGLLSLVHYRSTPCSKPLGILMFCSGIYAFGYAFEVMKGDPNWTFFWLRIEYLGISFIAACWLWLALEYTGKIKYITPSFLTLIFGISVFFLIAVQTNPMHHLYYTFVKTNNSGPFPTAHLGKGILYMANSAWLLGSLILSASLYIVHYTRVSAIFRRQALSMVIGAIGAVAGYSTYAIGLVPWDLDLGPMIIALNGSIFAFGILYFGLLDVSPIARDRVFESMQEGVIVTDLNGTIADFNPTAAHFLPELSREWIGQNLLERLPEFEILADGDNAFGTNPFIREDNKGIQYYEIRHVPVMVRANKIGTAWYMRQISEQYKLLEKLRVYAEKDGLTGIWNRRKWIELARLELVRASRYNRPLALMIIDIDHFKSVNDTMGHETGDQVIISTTNLITNQIRKNDIFGRIGGEEFAIILPEIDMQETAVVSNRLLKAVSDHKMDFQGKAFGVTISIGAAVCREGGKKTLEELMKESDHSLYMAKNSGRNRACFASEKG